MPVGRNASGEKCQWGEMPAGENASGENCQTACKPGSVRAVLTRDDHSSGTRLTARLTRPTRTAGRECPCSDHPNVRMTARPSLFGLAPGGVYPAAAVTGGAVRFYRTVSPLPVEFRSRKISTARAVCFLWHCPWGRPRRSLTGTVFPWSPDFPPSSRDNSGRPAVWRTGHGTVWVRRSRRRDHPWGVGVIAAG